MKFIDLTMPLWEGMPVPAMPFNVAFKVEDTWTYERDGYRMYSLTMDTEAGTCFLMPSQNVKKRNGIMLHELPLEKIIMRDTVVLTIPKKELEKITVEDAKKALDKADFREGDAVLLRTGWGDGQSYFKLGDDYVLKTPHYPRETTELIAQRMAKKKSDIFLTDTALISYPGKHIFPDFGGKKPKNYPSPEAKAYLKAYTPEKIKEDWPAFSPFPENNVTACKCVVNCGEIKKERIKLIITPLKLLNLPSSPCRVIAVEE